MRKTVLAAGLCIFLAVLGTLNAQIVAPKFGSGLQITGQDTSFYMKIGLRFQTLYLAEWDITDDGLSATDNTDSRLFIRRSRLKFDGWAVTPKLKYKMELSLSNRDNGGGNSDRYSNAANTILDASISWNFYNGFSIWAGQGKLPGNRERVISSGNLQFVDRSRLNSRYTLDRDAGLMLLHTHKIGGGDFILNETFAISSGEGKNLTAANVGGHGYTFKVEALPFGKFQSKGHYTGSAVKYETKPKLAIAAAYDINKNAGRERGQKGSFIVDDSGNALGKDLTSIFVDMMFKYQNISIMGEYVKRMAEDDDPNVYGPEDDVFGTYYVGSGTNLAIGYMTPSNWELATRWTHINPDEGVANDEDQYTVGISKFVVGHKLKVQTDATYRSIDGSDNDFFYRLQMDLHF